MFKKFQLEDNKLKINSTVEFKQIDTKNKFLMLRANQIHQLVLVTMILLMPLASTTTRENSLVWHTSNVRYRYTRWQPLDLSAASSSYAFTSRNSTALRQQNQPLLTETSWAQRRTRDDSVKGGSSSVQRRQNAALASPPSLTKTSRDPTHSNGPLPLNFPQPIGNRPKRRATSSTGGAVPKQSTSKCALILQRTYVRKLPANEEEEGTLTSPTSNEDGVELGNHVQPTGRLERVCISYEDVNGAIAEAKQNRRFELNDNLIQAIESIEPLPPFIAELGELNQEVTKLLAARFDLSSDEILNGLPLIDMSRTDFWPICPLMVRPVQCDQTGRFRAFTGHCNNLKNPSWGAAQTPFVRYLAPQHPDGIEKDRVSVLAGDDEQLPSPRLVTSSVHRDHDHPSGDLSLLIMVWGQIIDHDVALAAPPRGKFKWRPNARAERRSSAR